MLRTLKKNEKVGIFFAEIKYGRGLDIKLRQGRGGDGDCKQGPRFLQPADSDVAAVAFQ